MDIKINFNAAVIPMTHPREQMTDTSRHTWWNTQHT